MYSFEEVMTYCKEEDVKFVRLAFCDFAGNPKNIAIMPGELERAFRYGIAFDASAIRGFSDEAHSDLFLRPDPSTFSVLPWRPSHGRVVRMFCDIRRPDGGAYERDCRNLLKQAISYAHDRGVECSFGAEFEFYLFRTDEDGNPTKIPFDNAGYMDIAPEDKGENVRRSICLTLEDMGILPESSHHEEGPGQNEIDFRFSDALRAADNAVTFKSVVKTIAMQNGLHADFDPKPLLYHSGNGLHINVSLQQDASVERCNAFLAGVLAHVEEMTCFFNPSKQSYLRLGEYKAPKYVCWAHENRSALVRIPAAKDEFRRMELRSPDPMLNPYIAYALILYAGTDGIERKLSLPDPIPCNLEKADVSVTKGLRMLPASLEAAREIAQKSELIRTHMPQILEF